MGKYDNVTMKEYMNRKQKMFNDLGRLNVTFDEMEINNPDKALEIVMEYEPKVDWSKVKVDTKVLVRDEEDDNWDKRHFAKYENGIIWTWNDGRTSFTCFNNYEITRWNYAKLYKGDE